MNPGVFREYDIRGMVERDFDNVFVRDVGRAFATLLRRNGGRTIAVGRDCRLSSDKLFGLLVEGLLAHGIDVIDIGLVPTPLLYFTLYKWPVDGGVMITGSHNDAPYNGFKLALGQTTIYGEKIAELRRIIELQAFEPLTVPGRIRANSIIPEYQDFIMGQFRFERPLRVAIDAGNGCGGVIAAPLLRQLGVETTELYIEMDGRFPNHHPDPTIEANMRDLIEAVCGAGLDIGLAYDGDADRLGAVDETGRIVWGDELMVAFSRSILNAHPGATIIGEVKCSKRMYDDIARHGGRPIMWKTGHSLLKSKLKEEKALLAGEMSGHMFFADRYYGFDDAIYASFRLLEILSDTGRGLGAIIGDLEKSHFTPEIRLDCPDDKKFEIVRMAADYFRPSGEVSEIDGVRVNFADGWGLIRASNTQPALVLRFEASTAARLNEIRSLFEHKLRDFGAV
jgi:phosphomannomutase/phosphoglucomutase